MSVPDEPSNPIAVPSTVSPEQVAADLGTSAWWVRKQARRVPHLRLGKGKIRFCRAQVDALIELATVTQASSPPRESEVPATDVAVLGATVRSLGAHRARRGARSPAPPRG